MADFIDNTCEKGIDSDSDGDTEPSREIDWEKLSSIMSTSTLSALTEHLNSKSSQNMSTAPREALNENKKFSKKEYWESRFEEETEYDWLVTYEGIADELVKLINVDDRILVVGCGNSSFSERLYDSGFRNITNIDFSEVVIQNMKKLHENKRPLMKWICMDMTNLTFEDACFDVVIDKASMDALMVDEGDVWDPNANVINKVDEMCRTTRRVLRTGGVFLQISFAQPHFRTKYLMGLWPDSQVSSSNRFQAITGHCERYNWNLLPVIKIAKDNDCLCSFMYIMKCE